MYVPVFFSETTAEEIERIITTYPLATLVTNGADGMIAAHVPMLRSGQDKLIGHIALNNSMHRDIADGSEALVIFRSNDGYISPNWYPSKQAHHRHVPTWNYQAVHFNGALRFDHSEKFKRAVVGRLTKQFETSVNGEAAWRMADAPKDYMASMIDNIVGIELTVTSMVAKSKLSQNRDKEDFDSVIDQLEKTGPTPLADAMRRTRNQRAEPKD